MGLLDRWWEDPVASSTIFIAIIAGVFAVYQLRAVPADRRRRILDSMIKRFSDSSVGRGAVLKETPPLLDLGLLALQSAVEWHPSAGATATYVLSTDEILSTPAERNRQRLAQDLKDWLVPELGISYFSAAEIVESDVKFRALLWAIECIRDAQASQGEQVGEDVVAHQVVTVQTITEVKDLVVRLNPFLADYENAVFPARQMFGLWHLTLARISVACMPFVWERSLPRPVGGPADTNTEGDARWGRRILRVGIAAEHFNDVNRRHRTSAISWTPKGNPSDVKTVVIHPRLSKEMLGPETLIAGLPGMPRVLPYVRLWVRERYWSFVGALALRPRGRFTSYGGKRLAQHSKKEAELTTLLRYALVRGQQLEKRFSLSMEWNLGQLKGEIVAARNSASEYKRHWLYLSPSAHRKLSDS